jgi:DMSO reductase family type II enzyme heme b subunit
MGAPGAAVNAWYWRADESGTGRHLVAEGLGTTRTLDTDIVRGAGVWKGGRWRVVIARALRVATDAPVAQLEPGTTTGFGVAVWEGEHGERAGIKAFSGDWQDLKLDPMPTARR